MTTKEELTRMMAWLNWFYEGDMDCVANQDATAFAHLTAMAEAYEKVKAEAGKLRSLLASANLRAEVAEKGQELAEAELARSAPLMEAASKWDGRLTWESIQPLMLSINDYRTALKCKEGE